jgi:hypothetical protein
LSLKLATRATAEMPAPSWCRGAEIGLSWIADPPHGSENSPF